MPAWRDAPAVSEFLRRASRRTMWLHAARGAVLGFAAAILLLALATIGSLSAVTAIVAGIAVAVAGAIAFGLRAASQGRRSAATLVEQRAPQCRNVLVTASQLIDRPAEVRDYIGERVCRDAAQLTARLDLRRLFPARRALLTLGICASLWTAAVVAIVGRPIAGVDGAVVGPASISHIDVIVTPPAYTKRTPQSSRDPVRITALAGSHVQLTVSAVASSVSLETIDTQPQKLTAVGPSTFSGELVADADGFVAIEASGGDGQAGVRKLIGISVEPDRAPRVRITAPGKDLFLPDATRTLDLAVDADDDVGLASLELRYTKVAGSGESFTFTDGHVPLDVARTSDVAWTAKGAMRLRGLELSPGDMVVYRAVATDARPGAPAVESDSWVVEITAPGAVAMEGFAVDDERDRYALSQQMVIMKTEQLAARQSSMTADAFAEEAQNIAVEQRRVRAEFVFMMGGELADAGVDTTELHEEEEAAGEHDLAAGRLANQGRADLLRAIRSMSLAATSLMTAAVPKALVDERAALESLQRAFARSRYILRTLTVRERLDLSRRLTGVLAALVRNTRPIEAPPDNPRVVALRRALAGVATLAAADTLSKDDGLQATALAQSVMRIDPASEPLRAVASALTDIANAMSAGRVEDARRALDRATTDLARLTRAELISAPVPTTGPDLARLDGLLSDALRRRVK